MSGRWSRRLRRRASLPTEGEADLRYRGQSFELTVPLGPDLAARFHAAHDERYGYADRQRAIELVAGWTAEVRPGPGSIFAARTPTRRRAKGVDLPGATCWVPAGWRGRSDVYGTLVLERA